MNLIHFYQHLPEHLNPIAFSTGSFSVRWYSLGYLFGFVIVYLLLLYRIKKGEYKDSKFPISIRQLADQFPNKSQIPNPKIQAFLTNFFLYSIAGLLIGARLGYVIFYDLNYFIHNPLEIIVPSKVNCQLSIVNCLDSYGIRGMSYFGGLAGAAIAGVLFSKRNRINFWKLADFVVPVIPAGYFFGRIGNFLNGELYGRITDIPWGMYFPADPDKLLRHPSQLYEAFFEGIVLFIILWILRNKWSVVSSQLLVIYLFGYGLFRFFIEFFREPDPQTSLFFGWLTLGQIFSLLLISVSLVIYFCGGGKSVLQSES